MRILPSHFLAVALAAVFCTGALASENSSVKSDIVNRLIEQVKARKILVVERGEGETLWSDGAMLEVARTLPSGVQALLATAKEQRNLRPVIERMFVSRPTGWVDARVKRGSDGNALVETADGKISLGVNSAYMDYLRARFPGARIRVLGHLDPILFMEGDSIRATVMPVASAKPPAARKQ